MHADIEKDKCDEADSEIVAGFGTRNEVTEAHDVVHEENARALVEGLHAVLEERFKRLEVRQVDDQKDGEQVLDGQLHPEEV